MQPKQTPRVKAHERPRYRYLLVAFEPAGLDRNEVIRRLREAAGMEPPPWLTRYDGRHGIVRVARGLERRLREALERSQGPFRASPILTSGTIAGLERRHGRSLRGDR